MIGVIVWNETYMRDVGYGYNELAINAHTLFLLLISRLATVSTGWKTKSSATPQVESVESRTWPVELGSYQRYQSPGYGQHQSL